MENLGKQILEWKEKHGEVHQIEVDGHVGYVKKPNRQQVGRWMLGQTANPLKANEAFLNDCWLGGDEAIKTNDGLFFGAAQAIMELIEIKTATLKKL